MQHTTWRPPFNASHKHTLPKRMLGRIPAMKPTSVFQPYVLGIPRKVSLVPPSSKSSPSFFMQSILTRQFHLIKKEMNTSMITLDHSLHQQNALQVRESTTLPTPPESSPSIPTPPLHLPKEPLPTLPTPLTEDTSLVKKNIQVKAVLFDAKGQVRLIEEEVKKSELCSMHSLLRRDLKIIANPLGNHAPSILVREKAIIVNMAHVKALVRGKLSISNSFLADSVYIFDNPSEESHELHSFLMHELQGRLESKDSSPYFEMRALEAIFISVIHAMTSTQRRLLPEIEKCLSKLSESVDQDMLKTLLLLKNELTQFDASVEKVIHLLKRLLNNEEDMSNMYLTEKLVQKQRNHNDHQEVEYLLEHYQDMLEEIASITATTMHTIQATESLIQISLDTQRNNLIVFDLRATIGTLSIASSSFITSIYGMNLLNGFEDLGGILEMVAIGAVVSGSLVYMIVTRKLMQIKTRSIGLGGWTDKFKRMSDAVTEK